MHIDDEIRYRALAARDARFDGLFFVGVTSTRIYCRPICTARRPGRDRCRFYSNRALAERDGFRPCLRCRPEQAPGHPPVYAVRSTAQSSACRIEAGALNDGGSLDELAGNLGLSARQLRRAVKQEFGVSPIELAQTQRLLLAKQLLSESSLPITQVAFASGFESVRRFNALFSSHYRLTPTDLRREARPGNGDLVRLTLAYRPPLDWRSLLRFLSGRATARVEQVVDQAYLRTAAVGKHRGWLKVEPIAGRNALAVEISTSLVPALPEIMSRLKNLFDLSARPDVIASHLSADERFAPVLPRAAGLRVPGAFDGFELTVRAILGQRVSVRAATTLAGRLAARFGEPVDTPFEGLDRLSPEASRIAEASESEIAAARDPGSARNEHPHDRAGRRGRRAGPACRRRPSRYRPRFAGFPWNRRLDRSVHRHAGAAVARRVSRWRPGLDARSGREIAATASRAGRNLAPLAGVRSHVSLGIPASFGTGEPR